MKAEAEEGNGALTRATKEDRINRCVELMMTSQWVRGVTVELVAQDFGVSLDTMKKDAAEASRKFRADPTEREEVIGEWFAKLAGAQKVAAEKGDVRTLGSLLDIEAKARGVYPFGNRGGQPTQEPPPNPAGSGRREQLVSMLANPNHQMGPLLRDALELSRAKQLGLHAMIVDAYDLASQGDRCEEVS